MQIRRPGQLSWQTFVAIDQNRAMGVAADAFATKSGLDVGILSRMSELGLLHFADVTSAVRCAIALTHDVPSKGLPQARFGIDAGPLIARNVDSFGHTVNVAARLVDYARPSEVLVTEEVVTAVDEAEIQFAEIGPVSLKGIAAPAAVFSASLV